MRPAGKALLASDILSQDYTTMLSYYLGLRYLRKRRAAWLAFAAVLLSVAVPILVLGVMQGIVDATRTQVRAAESDLTVLPRGGALGWSEQSPLPTQLAQHPEIQHVSPFISGVAFINSRASGSRSDARNNYFTLIDGINWIDDWQAHRIDASKLHQRPVTNLNAPVLDPTERGSGFLTDEWRNYLVIAGMNMSAGIGGLPLAVPPSTTPMPGVILGRELIYGEGGMNPWSPLKPGRQVSFAIPDGKGGTIGRIQAEISDTLATGALEIDRFMTLMPMPLAQRLSAMDGRHPDSRGKPEISGYRLVLEQGAQASLIREQLEGQYFLYGQTWQERRGNLVGSLEVQRNILMLVMIVIQGICIFIIYAVFSTLVVEKRHDIGVLLGLGASPRAIAGAFLFAGQTACIIGGLAGWGAGWGALALLNPLSEWLGVPLFPQAIFYSPEAPISWDPVFPLLFIAVIMLVGLLASLIPAWRASRIDPVTTLRENG